MFSGLKKFFGIDKRKDTAKAVKGWDVPKNITLNLVYTAKDGTRYYEFQDLTQLPYMRSIGAEIATREAEFCISKEDLKKALNETVKLQNENNLAKAGAVLHDLLNRLEYVAEDETLLQLASVYFVQEGENVETYDSIFQREKIRKWREDSESLAFFLRVAFQCTRNYSTILDSDTVIYLRELTEKQSVVQEITGRSSILFSMK